MTSADLRSAEKSDRDEPPSASGTPVSEVPVLWITGLSGTGKTTLARVLTAELQRDDPPALLLDGDTVRGQCDGPAQLDRHDLTSRQRRARRMAQLAHEHALCRRPVIVATISLLREVQQWNRRHNACYGEIVLHASMDALRLRYPGLYGGDGVQPQRHVWGLDLVPDFPERAELSLQQDFDPASLAKHRDLALSLWRSLQARAGNQA